MVIFVAIINIY